ncbi:MAG TPA: hypothetical protein VE780_06010, partial [Thermoleophilaceae bacterium]|nr:hypothetical protein [Thermoleophilaceae bacterium]
MGAGRGELSHDEVAFGDLPLDAVGEIGKCLLQLGDERPQCIDPVQVADRRVAVLVDHELCGVDLLGSDRAPSAPNLLQGGARKRLVLVSSHRHPLVRASEQHPRPTALTT